MRGLSDHKTLSYFTRYHLVPEEELSKIKGSDESIITWTMDTYIDIIKKGVAIESQPLDLTGSGG